MLYATILNKLRETICLDTNHRNFLNQVYGLETLNDIQQFLCDDSQEIMTFYDWLFFPDLTFQMKIEALLSGQSITLADQSDLIDRLIKQNIQSKIYLDSKTFQAISIGPMIISPFVSRLRLQQHIPEKLARMPYKSAYQKNYVLVLLRNATIYWTDKRCQFIDQIIQSFLDNQKQLFEILPQMLIFCGQYQDSFIQELIRRKRHLAQNLERFQNLQALQEKHSMEFLISSGVRSIHVDVLQSAQEMENINSVLLKVNDYGLLTPE